MMPKPTREDVEKFREKLKTFINHKDVVDWFCDAYLAQEEELERKDKLIKMQDEFIADKSKLAAERSTQISQLEVELDQLKAENQALKRKGELLCCQCGVLEMENQELKASMEAEYIERQAKHIQALVGENEELKAKLEGTFKFDEPKRGEALRYVTDDETGVVRVKWETNHD